MSYWDISQMAQNNDLIQRVQACAAQENVEPNPFTWTADNMLRVTAAPGWADAWASAQAADNAAPGRDPAVITDEMILAQVQSLAGGE